MADLDYAALAGRVDARPDAGLPAPSWNVAPGRTVAVVAQDRRGMRHLSPALWSLIPAWATARPDYPTHNARVESACDKRTYAQAAASQRALIPANGYYEWTGDHVPYYFHPRDGRTLWLAGLYSWWRPPMSGDADARPWLLTATILTRDADPRAARVHDRMPVLLRDDILVPWLDPSVPGREILPEASRTGLDLSESLLDMRRVRPLRGDGPQLIEGTDERRMDGENGDADSDYRQPTLSL